MAADFVFKIIIIGDAGVGKSCLLRRFADQTFTDNYINTIGVDFKVRTLEMFGKTVKLNIWDSAGQERFRTIVNTYYRGAHGICLVYDITELDSFFKLNDWLNDVVELAEPNAKKLIVGTKTDMEAKRRVRRDQVETYANHCRIPFIETSSKNGSNVEAAFSQMTKLLLEEVDQGLLMPERDDRQTIKIDGSEVDGNPQGTSLKKRKCCQ